MRAKYRLAPESFTILAQRGTSACSNWPKSLVLPPRTSPPSERNFSATSGSARAALMAVFSFCTTASGVPAGARMPNQVMASKFWLPDSDMVGVEGSWPERCLEVTIKGCSFSLRT
jgi:hypothetical protein